MKDLSDAAFVRRFSMVIIGLSVIIAAVMIYAVTTGFGTDYHTELVAARAASRLVPVASAATSAAAAVPAAASASAAPTKAMSGKEVVANVCSACHETGMLGAPKIGNKADWEPRFKNQGGLAGLEKHAIHGLGNMPPRGGDSGLTDQDIHNAIQYMLSKAGIKS
ncbi:MAG TPA: c-type cytochrome [Nevskiaceae bacterium]|nr:c-type cytochrome [Nevskiaceae bacterium]